jgi:hypothetical protein
MLSAALSQVPVPVTLSDLGGHPERYHGRVVRTEVVLADFRPSDRWHHTMSAEGADYVEALGRAFPDARDGDKVAITGRFHHRQGGFVPRVILHATMQKVPFDVTPDLLRKGRKYDGRLVTFEDVVADVREWRGQRTIELMTRGVEVDWAGAMAKGDRVRVTGVYRLPGGTFDPPTVDVRAGGSVVRVLRP